MPAKKTLQVKIAATNIQFDPEDEVQFNKATCYFYVYKNYELCEKKAFVGGGPILVQLDDKFLGNN